MKKTFFVVLAACTAALILFGDPILDSAYLQDNDTNAAVAAIAIAAVPFVLALVLLFQRSLNERAKTLKLIHFVLQACAIFYLVVAAYMSTANPGYVINLYTISTVLMFVLWKADSPVKKKKEKTNSLLVVK
jgi:O-antigen/teichoic acid export membrane protein